SRPRGWSPSPGATTWAPCRRTSSRKRPWRSSSRDRPLVLAAVEAGLSLRVGRGAAGDDRDRPVLLQHSALDLLHVADAVLSRRHLDLLLLHALPPHRPPHVPSVAVD